MNEIYYFFIVYIINIFFLTIPLIICIKIKFNYTHIYNAQQKKQITLMIMKILLYIIVFRLKHIKNIL